MRKALILASALATIATPALAVDQAKGSQTEFPEYDLAAACAKLAAKFGDLAARTCARDENEARDASQYLWSDLPPDLQTHCLIVAKLIAGRSVSIVSIPVFARLPGRDGLRAASICWGNPPLDQKEMAGQRHSGIEGRPLLASQSTGALFGRRRLTPPRPWPPAR
jgi:hypothetical protein